MNDLVYVGYISGPFGIKGQLKVISDSNHLDKILNVGNKLVIDNNEYLICNYHFHKHHLVTLEGFEDINLINDLVKKDVYIKRSEIKLNEDEYLYADLLGCTILSEGNKMGVVTDILYNKSTIYLKSDNLIVPIIPKYIEKVDTKGKIVYGKNIKELVL